MEVYATQDHKQHDKDDANTASFEDAVQAVMALFQLVRQTINSKSNILIGWEGFVKDWLTLSPNEEYSPLLGGVAKGKPTVKQKPLLCFIVAAHPRCQSRHAQKS